jgi:hypothetical protein
VVDASIRLGVVMGLEVAVDELGVLTILGPRVDVFGRQQRQTEHSKH